MNKPVGFSQEGTRFVLQVDGSRDCRRLQMTCDEELLGEDDRDVLKLEDLAKIYECVKAILRLNLVTDTPFEL